MSWFCDVCEEIFPDDKPAYGWICQVYCRECWEKGSGKCLEEPPMPPVVTPKQRAMVEGLDAGG